MSEVIQALWIGPSLSSMERLAVRSFLANGHEVHLYAYGEVEGVPEGIVYGSSDGGNAWDVWAYFLCEVSVQPRIAAVAIDAYYADL